MALGNNFKSGGNVQRENHMNKMMGGGKGSPDSKPQGNTPADSPDGEPEASGQTTIEHHGDGTHTINHADGEKHENVSTGEMAMHLHSKHEVGPAMHVHNHGGAPMHEHEGMEGHHTVTTHHVGHDGTVEGPHHHEGMDAAAEHMKSAIGDGGGEMPHEGGGGGQMADTAGGRAPLY
jgi:hypothetical protein